MINQLFSIVIANVHEIFELRTDEQKCPVKFMRAV